MMTKALPFDEDESLPVDVSVINETHVAEAMLIESETYKGQILPRSRHGASQAAARHGIR